MEDSFLQSPCIDLIFPLCIPSNLAIFIRLTCQTQLFILPINEHSALIIWQEVQDVCMCILCAGGVPVAGLFWPFSSTVNPFLCEERPFASKKQYQLHVIISLEIIRETFHHYRHNYLPIRLLYLIKRKMLQLWQRREKQINVLFLMH